MAEQKIEREEIDIGSLIPKSEHGIYAYYGRLGQGKTYAMTADILHALSQGKVVYTNYPINWEGYDERFSLVYLIIGFLGLRKRYYEFSSSNLRRIEIDEDFHEKLSQLTDCIVALDEGYVAFDSYEMAKMSMLKRKNVLHTRHFDRSIWYTTQRPSAVHVAMRAQTNVFYKVRKFQIPFLKIPIFRRTEHDLGSDESVNENETFSTQFYWGSKRVFQAYDTKYLRDGLSSSQEVLGTFWDLTMKDKFYYFKKVLGLKP